MNQTECDHLIKSVQWTEPKNLISLAILGFIDILVIVGNCLVIAAVFCSHKLRSVTNFFIVSLAVADLLVGLAVLPFSSTWEVFKVWIFGDVWCKIWLAVDVLLCTASILNLCAISLDRYVAVTRPVTYPSIMSTKRAKCLIAGLWVLSFVICFPPLVGWKNQQNHITTDDLIYQRDNYTFVSATMSPRPYVKCPWKCELTNDAGYVVYSALGSFYIPMLVMLFFYWRIYRAAVRTTRAINQGFRTTKGMGGKNNQVDEENVTLRMHRGNKNQRHNHNSDISISNSMMNLDSLKVNTSSVSSMSSFERKRRRGSRCKDRVTISISYPTTDHITSPTISTTSSNQVSMISSCSKEPIALRHNNINDCSETQKLFKENIQTCSPKGEHSPNNSAKKGKRTLSGAKVQVRKFRMETKAAKTLAIIVGMFVLCWCPFFTLYLIRPFCDDCINPILFSILFWLGYCNSAVNPFIYAMFSKDFRFAFKRVIYRCFCSKKYLEEHKFHVLHRFVPIPFAAGLAGQRSDLNIDLTR